MKASKFIGKFVDGVLVIAVCSGAVYVVWTQPLAAQIAMTILLAIAFYHINNE